MRSGYGHSKCWQDWYPLPYRYSCPLRWLEDMLCNTQLTGGAYAYKRVRSIPNFHEVLQLQHKPLKGLPIVIQILRQPIRIRKYWWRS
ncbi:hypothetical protein [Deinococcus misasensis]|uniref:hypothetical protein n=1 Tax=Deinococcus misasensis TaxID=392413 RepID=UPI0005502C85|nr:hypothetical protein [Deinococcus misasensis]